MLHRHLNHEGFTLAAIDDVIERGLWHDWAVVANACAHLAVVVFDRVCARDDALGQDRNH